MQKQKLAQFFHGWKNPVEMKKPRNLKVCEACLKHGYMHLNGEQILHYANNACCFNNVNNVRAAKPPKARGRIISAARTESPAPVSPA